MNQACWAKSEIVKDAMEAKGISLDLETEGMRNKQRITIYTILFTICLSLSSNIDRVLIFRGIS